MNAVTLLEAWANINSGSKNLVGLEAMRAALAIEFATLPFASLEHVALPGTPALALRIIVRPAAKRQVFLSGHYDTVYLIDHSFQCCSYPDATILRGPGVADMKGGLVVILEALRRLEQSPYAAQLGYEVLLTPDEETGSIHSKPLLEAIAHSKRHDFALVFEPARANGDLVKSRKGTGTFTITVHGKAAHAGRDPKSGHNAILALTELLPQVNRIQDEMPGILINFGKIQGGGPVNIVPDFASADFNLRITAVEEGDIFLRRVDEILLSFNARGGCRSEIDGHFDRKPKVSTKFEERLFEAWRECGRELGTDFSWQHVGGGSDGNLLSSAGLDNLDGLGPIGDHLHSDREYCLIDSLTQRAAIASLFLQKYASGAINLSAEHTPLE
ncbi:MAG: hydrolase [Pirellulaceae bacterium]|nr:hydrolase [Pirellulaceae bacterium]